MFYAWGTPEKAGKHLQEMPAFFLACKDNAKIRKNVGGEKEKN